MFKAIKTIFYLGLILGAVFLYWFIPKYSFIQKNPGFCAKLTSQLYYCGQDSNIDALFKTKNE